MHTVKLARRAAVLLATAALAFGAAVAPSAGAAAESSTEQSFRYQATTAGLTSAQATALQSEVDGYLAVNGGKQVTPNKIDLDGRGQILVAVPGEAYPRDFAAGPGNQIASKCTEEQNNGWFCAFSKSGYQGTVIQMYRCGLYDVTRFSTGGSWINNQTVGRRARMYNGNLALVFTTEPAYSSDISGNWGPVDFVQPC